MEIDKKITINLVSPITIILFLAFFFAKIFDKIDWSWWWVFSPLWIPLAIVVVIMGFIALLFGIIAVIDLINGKPWK